MTLAPSYIQNMSKNEILIQTYYELIRRMMKASNYRGRIESLEGVREVVYVLMKYVSLQSSANPINLFYTDLLCVLSNLIYEEDENVYINSINTIIKELKEIINHFKGD